MTVFINGQFVPEHAATVSVFDRSFLYGDGLFETMLVSNGKPFRWSQHLERLEHGAQFLGINVPFSRETLAGFAAQLIFGNKMPEALLRLTLSRGVGLRGYSPKGAVKPTLVMTVHPAPGAPSIASTRPSPAWQALGAPHRWCAHTASFRLPAGESLAQFKSCNKLTQILARAEAEAAGADEALLLNTDGFVVEAASSNLFWIERGTVCTPPLASGILAGVTRKVVCELCAKLGMPVRETNLRPEQFAGVEAAFLSLSSHGIIALGCVDGANLGDSPIVARLREAYASLVQLECA
jgi:branched-chain amino acid aminotransferase